MANSNIFCDLSRPIDDWLNIQPKLSTLFYLLPMPFPPQLLETGLEQLDWVSTAFPDFLAKANAAVCGDLQSTLDQVHGHVQSITAITQAWSRIEGLDMFNSEVGPQDLAQLQEAHK